MADCNCEKNFVLHNRCAFKSMNSPNMRGQAAVETMFALLVLVFLLVVIHQLFVLSDKTITIITRTHFKTTKAVHEIDSDPRFEMVEVISCETVPPVAGMQWATQYFDRCEPTDPPGFPISRHMAVYGGAYQGREESLFARRYAGTDACPRGKRGNRERTVRSAL